MLLETIETPDIQLAKLLIARKLKDFGLDVDPTRITTSMKNADLVCPPIQFRYPLRGLSVSIQSILSGRQDIGSDAILALVEEQVAEYHRVSADCPHLEEELAEAKTVARREVAKARRRGMAIRFLDVRPSTVEAGGGWLPVPEVQMEVLSEALVPERFSIVAEEIGDVSRALTDERLLKRQMIRAVRKAYLDGIGAAGAIDAVALTALMKGGHDVPHTIKRMRESTNGLLLGAGEEGMYLSWDNGLINVDVGISAGVSYKASHLTIDASRMPLPAGDLRGQPVHTIVDSALLDGAIIASVEERFGKHLISLEPRYVVYDAATLQPVGQLFPM